MLPFLLLLFFCFLKLPIMDVLTLSLCEPSCSVVESQSLLRRYFGGGLLGKFTEERETIVGIIFSSVLNSQ